MGHPCTGRSGRPSTEDPAPPARLNSKHGFEPARLLPSEFEVKCIGGMPLQKSNSPYAQALLSRATASNANRRRPSRSKVVLANIAKSPAAPAPALPALARGRLRHPAERDGRCAPGAYACPLSATACVAGLAAYETCPGLDGTYLDASLPEADRLAWLADNVPLDDMIGQLVNAAPAVDAVDLPAYNWLNDNEHGVKGTARATVYPMGASLGASWSVALARRVGAAIGNESRATHNGCLLYTSPSPRDKRQARMPSSA